MQLSVEISMYPLDADYERPIVAFIEQLRQHPAISVRTNSMSTQIFGAYDATMHAIQESMKQTFLQEDKVVMVMKFINADLNYVYEE